MAKRKKKHHKSGRETSHLLSINPGLDTLNTVMLPYLYRWHNRGHRDYGAHVVELLRGFRLSQEIRSIYTGDLIGQCVDSFRALVGEQEPKAFDPYDVYVAMDMEIQLALDELMDQQRDTLGDVKVTAGDLRKVVASLRQRVEAFRPELASDLTEDVLLGRATVVGGSCSLFMAMLRAANDRGGDTNENVPAVLYDFWDAKSEAQQLASKLGDPADWRRRHIRRVPYGPRNVPLSERPRRIVVVARTRVNSEYETTT